MPPELPPDYLVQAGIGRHAGSLEIANISMRSQETRRVEMGWDGHLELQNGVPRFNSGRGLRQHASARECGCEETLRIVTTRQATATVV